MFSNKKKNSVNYLINLLFCFFPISLIIGSLVVNVNLFIFLILSFFYIKKNNYKTNLDYTKIILTCFFLFIIITTIRVPAQIVLGVWFVMQLSNGLATLGIDTTGGIAWFAHIGGFIAGVGGQKLIKTFRFV